MKKYRNLSIDTFKTIAIYAVVCLHVPNFWKNMLVCYFFENLCRFAVPFFFITSGFWFSRSLLKGTSVNALLYSYLKRLFTIFIFWSLLYGILSRAIINNIVKFDIGGLLYSLSNNILAILKDAQAHPVLFFVRGGCEHLWFLPALMMGLAIVGILIKFKKQRWIMPIAISLFVFGLLGKAYAHTPIGIHLPVNFNTRNGPFFSTLFVSLGWWFSICKIRPSALWSAVLIIFGMTLTFIEVTFLWKSFNMIPDLMDYVLGTVPYGAGVFLFAVSRSQVKNSTILSRIGRYSLGIYVIHEMVIYLKPVNKIVTMLFTPDLIPIVFPLFVFLISFAIVWILSQFSLTKKLVA